MSMVFETQYGRTELDLMIEQRCAIYKHRFGISAHRASGGGQILATTDRRTAGVLAPNHLAATALSLLNSAPVPVYSVGGDRWMFLTEGIQDAPTARRVVVTAFRYPIVPVLEPSPLALPTPGSALRSWLYLPDGPHRLPITTVLSALEAAVIRVGL